MGYFPYQLVIAGPFWILGDLNLTNPGAVQPPNLPTFPRLEHVCQAHHDFEPPYRSSGRTCGRPIGTPCAPGIRAGNQGFLFFFRRNQFMALKPSFLRGARLGGGRGRLTSHNQFTQVSIPCMFFVATRESFRYIEEGKFRSLFW